MPLSEKVTLRNDDKYHLTENLGLWSFVIYLNCFVTLQFQMIVPQLINFWIFCRTSLSYLVPPRLITFPDFVLQIFQRLLKRIVLNKEPQKQRVNEMEQEEQEDEYINAFDFLNNFSVDIAKICY